MAYLTVTTQADVVDAGDGKLSLREAVAQANASASADTIRFIAALEGKTLVLTGGELVVTQDLTIDGGDDPVTIDGNRNGRILNIAGAGTDVRLQQLTLAHGGVSRRGERWRHPARRRQPDLTISTIRDSSRRPRRLLLAVRAGRSSPPTAAGCALVDSTIVRQ